MSDNQDDALTDIPQADNCRLPKPAPLMLRALALVIDLAIISTTVIVLSVGPWQLARPFLTGRTGIGFSIPNWLLPIPLIILLTPFAYHKVFNGHNLLTLGSRICRISVVPLSGGAIGYIRAVGRYVLSCFVAACVGIGTLIATTSAHVSLESEPVTSVSFEPSSAIQGAWVFDADTMRTTPEYGEQIALAQDRGYSHEEAIGRAERILATFAGRTLSITDRMIEMSNGNERMTARYRVDTVDGDRIAIVTTTDDGSESRTTMRVLDNDHIAVSDDSHADVPIWLFRRVRE